jgi:hypothetical protein
MATIPKFPKTVYVKWLADEVPPILTIADPDTSEVEHGEPIAAYSLTEEGTLSVEWEIKPKKAKR